jgi:hypothetical protein
MIFSLKAVGRVMRPDVEKIPDVTFDVKRLESFFRPSDKLRERWPPVFSRWC